MFHKSESVNKKVIFNILYFSLSKGNVKMAIFVGKQFPFTIYKIHSE